MCARENRPNPDELLARIKAEEEKGTRGKLKIFLGYAAGIGKTYAMLEAARQRKAERDVVVAYVETHGRLETEALLEGLEVIPRKQVEYRGVTLPEMDLDAVLARRPRLALVDELAHTNAPGSRNLKRYQDAEELLEAGIDVYSTLNVQHVESLRNVVAQVTNVWVRETVPDSVIDSASEIEIVDLPPDELIKRLKEGKVYVPEQIARATSDFFRKGNLIALRELTMRTAAARVNEQMRDYMQDRAIPGPRPIAECLLVCVSHSALGPFLVRTARRLATQLRAEWFVAHVETPGSVLSSDEQDRLAGTLRLAERMGAKAITLQGHSVAEAVIEFALKNDVTKMIVGRPQVKGLHKLPGQSIVNEIIRRCERFDVFIVSGREEGVEQVETPKREVVRGWQGYLQGLALLVLATLLGQLVHGLFSPNSIVMIYLLCVAVTAVFWGLGPSIMVSILSVPAFDFFFISPTISFGVGYAQYLFTFVGLLFVGVMISYLTSRVRRQTEAARRREKQTAALYALGQDLAIANDLESYVKAVIKRTKETFGHDVLVFLPNAQRGTLKAYGETPEIAVDEKESAEALWSFQHQRMVGHGTDTLANARDRYIPLITARGTVAVMALRADGPTDEITIEQERLLEAYADLAAVAIEGILMGEEAKNAQVLRATEKLQAALLSSISRDLRTPMLSIIKALGRLQERGLGLDDATKNDLIQLAFQDAERLNHLIANLLDMSRIEAGAITATRRLSSVKNLIDLALEKLSNRAGTHQLKMDIPSELPLVSVDFDFVVQALINILDNALKYSPTGSVIEVRGRQVGQHVEIEVADRGVGIPPQDLQRVFDKFYRVQRPDNAAGTGLGLSISKGFVEALGGRIVAENRPGGGTIVRLTLPMDESFEEA